MSSFKNILSEMTDHLKCYKGDGEGVPSTAMDAEAAAAFASKPKVARETIDPSVDPKNAVLMGSKISFRLAQFTIAVPSLKSGEDGDIDPTTGVRQACLGT